MILPPNPRTSRDLIETPVRKRRRISPCAGAKRHGVILPLFVFLLPVVLLFLGFTVDVAYVQKSRAELRAVSDIAARAAATKLAETGDEARARLEAVRVASANKVAGKPLQLRSGDIEIGRSTRNNLGRWVFSPGGSDPNAVRVTGGNATSVDLFFGGVLGMASVRPNATATASFNQVDICLVLDRSTSMKTDVNSNVSYMYTNDPKFCAPPGSNTRWAALDSAVKVFTDTLRTASGREQVAIVTYSSAFKPVVYCGTSSSASSLDLGLSYDLSVVDSRINSLSNSVWNGNTDIESGVRTGLSVFSSDQNARAGAERYMIVMTDGNQNVGNVESAADAADAAGITVHTVTFSVDANQALMKSVATRAGGRHMHANTPEELREVFRELAALTSQLTD